MLSKDFWKNKLDSRKTWGTINKIVNPNKTFDADINLVDEFNNEVSKDNIAEAFNDYISSIGMRLRENVVNDDNDF